MATETQCDESYLAQHMYCTAQATAVQHTERIDQPFYSIKTKQARKAKKKASSKAQNELF